MKIKKEYLGMGVKVKDQPRIVIEDNPEKFEYYKNLGLDIFEEEKKKKKKENDSAE